MAELLVGIDFGTTNTVITVFDNSKTECFMDGIFKIIPSKIGIIDNKIYCGNYIPTNCQNIISNFKITLGEDLLFFNKYTHIDLLIIFYKHLYNLIYQKYNISCIRAVITVPSNFNDKQRELIKSAYEIVNINVIRIINEPSAAALSYGLNFSCNDSDQILVIDLGGGTMDFTVLYKNDFLFEIIHSEGLNNLGGNNFTQVIYDDIIKYMPVLESKTVQKEAELPSLELTKLVVQHNIIWNQAQKIKEKLSYLNSYEYNGYILDNNKFEILSKKLINQVKNTLINIIETYPNINYIIMVGGTSRIPILQDAIKSIIKINLWIHPNLEYVVSEGAALYAAILENKYTDNKDVILIDVVPLSLGLELSDGSFSIIIPKNTPLPVKRSHKYTIDTPGETNITIRFYQGERKIANKNILIAEYIFDKLSKSTMPIIEIIFKIDLNSIITITIIDKKSGKESNLTIKDIPNINQDNILELSNNTLDDDELVRIQHIYLIKTHIENSLSNLLDNELITFENKEILIDEFKNIENNLDTMNNLQLIETFTNLQENYNVLSLKKNIDMISDNQYSDVEKIILNEKKEELKNKIKLLLIKNENSELESILNELSYNNITIHYINEKLNLLNELDNINKVIDYKQELHNLCLYLKLEIENGEINSLELNNIVNNILNNIINNIDCDWQSELNLLNNKCEIIYNNL
jgi:molecular chaperone DnaK